MKKICGSLLALLLLTLTVTAWGDGLRLPGGLTTIEEKSLGAIMKSGSRPIQGVMNYTDMVTDHKGLWIKDTPGREPEILTGMACGIVIMQHRSKELPQQESTR